MIAAQVQLLTIDVNQTQECEKWPRCERDLNNLSKCRTHRFAAVNNACIARIIQGLRIGVEHLVFCIASLLFHSITAVTLSSISLPSTTLFGVSIERTWLYKMCMLYTAIR